MANQNQPVPAERTYITEFDALRFFAAILTTLYHGFTIQGMYGLQGLAVFPISHEWGANTVTFFFVLSGFLITLLLVREKEKFGTVNISKFYLRRIFRIWPLYYLIVVLGLFIMPYLPGFIVPPDTLQELSGQTLTDYAVWFSFFSNLCKLHIIPDFLFVSYTWSISVEEQFYAVWPWLMKSLKKPVYGMIALVLVCMAMRYTIYNPQYGPGLRMYLSFYRFDCMAIGGMVAVLYHQQYAVVQRFMAQPWVLYVLAVACALITTVPSHEDQTYLEQGYATLYAFLLMALATQPQRAQWLNHPWLRHLGKISYGIYMYNVLACYLAINLVYRLGGNSLDALGEPFSTLSILYFVVLVGLTIGISHLSYEYFEAPFLALKDRLGAVKARKAHAA